MSQKVWGGVFSEATDRRVEQFTESVSFDRRLYAHRHTIENYFARIKRHRRIATRYEKLAVTFLGFIQFATVLDWLTHEV